MWRVCYEIALHQCAATVRAPSPSRWGFATHAAARDAGDDAVTTIHRGASVRLAEVPHLRASTLPATWPARRAGGDQPGHHGLQPETHAECAGRQPAPSGASRITECHRCPTNMAKTKKAMSGVSGHRLFNFEPAVS